MTYVVRTDAGLCGLWQPEDFADVSSLGDGEERVAGDDALVRRIGDGVFVPLNVGGDGAWQVDIRSGHLSSREERYLLVASEPYLLKSEGVVELGGLEQVGDHVGGATRIPLAAGRYRVHVNLLERVAEPGPVTPDGRPAAAALPDFVVLVEPETHPGADYRVNVETFQGPA